MLLCFKVRPVFKVGTVEWVINGWSPWRRNFLTIQSTKVVVAEPGMITNIQVGTSEASKSIFWIRHDNLSNQVLSVGAQATSFWEAPLSAHNLFKQSYLIHLTIIKRILACQHFVQQDPIRPHVGRLVVSFAEDHLGSNKEWSSTKRKRLVRNKLG